MVLEYDYSKLKGRIVEKYGTQRAFAEALGTTQVAVSNKMNQKSGFDTKDIERWSDLLEIDRADYSIFYFAKKV